MRIKTTIWEQKIDVSRVLKKVCNLYMLILAVNALFWYKNGFSFLGIVNLIMILPLLMIRYSYHKFTKQFKDPRVKEYEWDNKNKKLKITGGLDGKEEIYKDSKKAE